MTPDVGGQKLCLDEGQSLTDQLGLLALTQLGLTCINLVPQSALLFTGFLKTTLNIHCYSLGF